MRKNSYSILKVATCQFAVSGDIERNARQIMDSIRTSAKKQADIVHFPECALSGYAGVDFKSFEGFNWKLLDENISRVKELAAKLKLWIVLGGVHRLTGSDRPHNSVYVINPTGRIVCRYDKRFCMAKELVYYTPGDRFVSFTVNGVRCSVLICFDARFPELYRALYRRSVKCIFQSFYNARQAGPSVHTHIMRQLMQAHAAINNFWISMSNSSGRYSPYPSCFIQPDGVIAAQLKLNTAGMTINMVDMKKTFYDPAAPFRNLATKGILTNKSIKPANEETWHGK